MNRKNILKDVNVHLVAKKRAYSTFLSESSKDFSSAEGSKTQETKKESELSTSERQQVTELQQRGSAVRSHEAAILPLADLCSHRCCKLYLSKRTRRKSICHRRRSSNQFVRWLNTGREDSNCKTDTSRVHWHQLILALKISRLLHLQL